MQENDKNDFSKLFCGDAEFIPLITDEGTVDFGVSELPSEIPILPLRGTVLFPTIVMPITAGREKSLKLIKDAYKKKSIIGIVSQKNDADDPSEDDLYKVGTLARIVKTLNMPDGTSMVIIQGADRFALDELTSSEPYWTGKVSIKPDGAKQAPKNAKVVSEAMRDLYLKFIKLIPNFQPDMSFAVQNIDSPYFLLNYIATHLEASLEEKQKLLELNDFTHRATKVLSILAKNTQMQEVKMQIQKKVSNDLDKQQRDY